MLDDVVGFLTSPHLIDLILVFAVLEAIGLVLLRHRLGSQRPGAAIATPTQPSLPNQDAARGMDSIGVNKGRAPAGTAEIILLVLPGLCLMLALRTALDGAAWPWVPVALAAALVAHLADIWKRWLS